MWESICLVHTKPSVQSQVPHTPRTVNVPIIPALPSLEKQKGQKFKVNLNYIASSRPE